MSRNVGNLVEICKNDAFSCYKGPTRLLNRLVDVGAMRQSTCPLHSRDNKYFGGTAVYLKNDKHAEEEIFFHCVKIETTENCLPDTMDNDKLQRAVEYLKSLRKGVPE